MIEPLSIAYIYDPPAQGVASDFALSAEDEALFSDPSLIGLTESAPTLLEKSLMEDGKKLGSQRVTQKRKRTSSISKRFTNLKENTSPKRKSRRKPIKIRTSKKSKNEKLLPIVTNKDELESSQEQRNGLAERVYDDEKGESSTSSSRSSSKDRTTSNEEERKVDVTTTISYIYDWNQDESSHPCESTPTSTLMLTSNERTEEKEAPSREEEKEEEEDPLLSDPRVLAFLQKIEENNECPDGDQPLEIDVNLTELFPESQQQPVTTRTTPDQKEKEKRITMFEELEETDFNDKNSIYNYLAQLNSHERDVHIELIPRMEDGREHVYRVRGIEYPSVSRIVSQYFNEVKSEDCLATMKRGRGWNETHRLWGKSDTEILTLWWAKGKEASELGKSFHQYLEKFYNQYAANGYKLVENSFDPDLMHLPEYQQWKTFHFNVVEKGGLKPFRTEWKLFTDRYKIAGTPDILFTLDNEFILMDWKRVTLKDDFDFKSRMYAKYGKGPLAHLKDVNYWHYAVSLSMYKFMFKECYNINIKEPMYLVVCHPTRQDNQFGFYQVPYLEQEVAQILEEREKEVLAEQRSVSLPLMVAPKEKEADLLEAVVEDFPDFNVDF
jgi:hypothetical protein